MTTPRSVARTQAQKAVKRAHILETAERVTLAGGPPSLDALALAAGMGKATLYLYFKDDQELFRALAIQMLRRLPERKDIRLQYAAMACIGRALPWETYLACMDAVLPEKVVKVLEGEAAA